MSWKRRLRWLVIVALAFIALLLAAQLTSPFWLDQAAVKREISRLIARATGGTAHYERIGVRIFPLPGATVTGVRVDLPGMLQVKADTVLFDIRLLPLFRGKVEPYRLRARAPEVHLRLADTSPAKATTPAAPFSLSAVDSSVRVLLRGLVAAAPGLEADVQDGQLNLILGKSAPIAIRHLNVRASVANAGISADVAFASETVDACSVRLVLIPADLAGELRVQLTGIHTDRLRVLIGAGAGWPVDPATLNIDLALQLHGLRDAQLTATVNTARVALHVGGGRVELGRTSIDATIRTRRDTVELALRRVVADSLHISATGTATWRPRDGFTLGVALGDLDLPTVQAAARRIPAVAALIDSLPVRITAGTASGLTLQSSGHALGDLFALPAMHLTGGVSGVELTVTAFHDLPVHDAVAEARLDAGVLRAQSVGARLGATTARDGTLEMDLTRDVPPLQGSVTAAVDLAEGLAIARRDLGPDARKALAAVEQLEGSALARVFLGGNTNRVAVRIEASELSVRARYEGVPFPIHIERGDVTVTPSAVMVRKLAGTIGHSAYDGIAADLSLTGPPVLSAHEGSVRLALGEIISWASTQPKLRSSFEGVNGVTGSLVISLSALHFPLDSAKQLTFAAVVSPQALAVDAPRYAPPVRLHGGAIAVTERSVVATDVGLSVLDARLSLSGSTGDYRERIDEARATTSGTVGPDALQWAFGRAKLPATLLPRDALELSSVGGSWSRSGRMRAAGSVRVVRGPSVAFSVESDSDRLSVERLTLRDDSSNVTVAGSVEGEHFRGACDGRVAGSSIDRLFAEPPVRLAWLDCAIHTEGDFKHPRETEATGMLAGAAIRLPTSLPMPVTIDRLALSATGPTLRLDTVRLSSGASRMEVTGTIAIAHDAFVVDANVRGDTVSIALTEHKPDSAASPPAAAAPAPKESNAEIQSKFYRSLLEIPATGTVSIDLGLLRVGHWEAAPLHASASIEGTHATLRLTRAAFCGIALTGGLAMQPDSIALHVTLHASDVPIAGSVACLSDKRVQLTGTVTANGSLTSSGKMGTLAEHVSGSFALDAKNGVIEKFDELGRVLALVNVTQGLTGQNTKLGVKGIAYSAAKIRFEFRGTTAELKEFSVDATGFEAAAHGTVDYVAGTMQIDVLVAPLKTANWVIGHIPLVRDIFGGTVLAIPVRVTGSFDNPTVVPLGPSAVSSRLTSILGNTLKLPTHLIPAGAPKDTTQALPPPR